MRLSVIVPTLNRAKTLGAQLDALSRQQWSEGWEVIVADNGSTDHTRDVVRAHAARLPDFRVVAAAQRRSRSHALNVGARSATGDGFLFCDDDDVVGDGWLAAMGRALAEHPFVACQVDASRLNPPWLAESRIFQRTELQQIPYPPYFSHAAGATMGVRRSVFDALGGFDGNQGGLEDTWFCVRAQLAGIPLHFVPDAVVHMRFRHTYLGMFRQARRYGTYSTLMYKRMRQLGTPPLPHPIRDSLIAWRSLLRSLPSLRGRTGRAVWAFSLGYRVGRLGGSVKHRVLAP